MKKLFVIFVALFVATSMFSQTSSITKTGWKKDAVLSYCEEYDLMVGDGGYWVIDWDQSKDDIRRMLIKDGFRVQETDSTLEWTQSQIYSCSVKFGQNGKIAFANSVIIVTTKHGPDIANSLKTKYDLMHGDSGKFQSFDSSTGYTWLDNRCKNSIYTMLAKKVLDDGKYFISVFTSKIGN